MTTLYVLCGPPGAGKSTWARENAGRLQAVVVCSDDVRRDLEAEGRDPWDGDSVFAEVELRARGLLQADRSVVLDATHFQRRYRTYIRDVVSGIDVQRVGIWFVVPLEVCLQRNAGRDGVAFGDRRMSDEFVRALAEAFEPPGSDEFDEVVTVNP
ncbi:MAG: AAA family ATPase [Ilumatobacteraceae bacterium]